MFELAYVGNSLTYASARVDNLAASSIETFELPGDRQCRASSKRFSGDEIILDQDETRDRVVDRRMRVTCFFDDIASWLTDHPNDQPDTVGMNVELMQRYDVPPARVPVLHLSEMTGQLAEFIPVCLSIIGAGVFQAVADINGRLNLFATKRQFVIVDRWDDPAQTRWETAPAFLRRESEPLSTSALLLKMLRMSCPR